MPNYTQDPNDSTKQVAGPLTDQHYDRARNVPTGSFVKTPHYVLVNSTLTNKVGFFFGSSASYAAKATAEGDASVLTGSQHYTTMLSAGTVGTVLHINPCAYSGSTADIGKITFVYKGGLDGMGRP